MNEICLKNPNRFLPVSLFLLIFAACSSVSSTPVNLFEKPSPELARNHLPKELNSESAEESAVDIQYVLGRDHHRFLATSHEKSVTVNTYLEKKVLEEGPINQEKYVPFLKKAFSFIQTSQKSPPRFDACRTPFTVTVRIGKESQTVRGCRSSDDGSLSKLVRDGEFLLYSKN